MVAITNIVLLATAAAATVLPRDYSTLNSDFQTINADTVQLTKDTNAYNGGVANAIPIQNDYNTLDQDVKDAADDAKNSNTLSASDAQKLIDYTNNTLEPNVVKAINALNSKKSNFDADGLSGTVCNNLKQLKTDQGTLGSNLIAIAPQSKKSATQSAINKINADLDKGINTFC